MKKIIGLALLLALIASMALYAAPRSVEIAQIQKANAQKELAAKERQLQLEQAKVAKLQQELAQAKTEPEKARIQAELTQLTSSCSFIYIEIDGLYQLIIECDIVISQGQ